MPKYPILSREKYGRALKDGVKFRDAGLYTPDQAPKGTIFVFVELIRDYKILKQVVSSPVGYRF